MWGCWQIRFGTNPMFDTKQNLRIPHALFKTFSSIIIGEKIVYIAWNRMENKKTFPKYGNFLKRFVWSFHQAQISYFLWSVKYDVSSLKCIIVFFLFAYEFELKDVIKSKKKFFKIKRIPIFRQLPIYILSLNNFILKEWESILQRKKFWKYLTSLYSFQKKKKIW